MLLDLPLPAFDSLYMSAFRINCRARADRLYDQALGSQGTGKSIRKFADELNKIGEPGKPRNDVGAFLQAYGSGF